MYLGNASSTIRWQQRLLNVRSVLRRGKKRKATFATIDRQIDGGLLTRCVEVSSPKHNILAAESTRQCLILCGLINSRVQSIITTIQDSPISVVGLEGDISRRMVGHHPIGVVKRRFDLRQAVAELPSRKGWYCDVRV